MSPTLDPEIRRALGLDRDQAVPQPTVRTWKTIRADGDAALEVQAPASDPAAGTSVELHVHPGAPHGFDGIAPRADVTARARADRLRVLARL